MSASSRMLRWYPAAWRERYGDELTAMVQDSLGDTPPSRRFRMSMAWSGLRERSYSSGLIGSHGAACGPTRARAGALSVFASFAAFVWAGGVYVKVSEHFAPQLGSGARGTATAAYDVVAVGAVVALGFVVAGALVAVVPFARFLRTGGWRAIRRHVQVAAAVTVGTVAIGAGFVAWAHHLSYAQRNGTDALYSAGAVVFAVAIAATLASCSTAVVATGRRLDFSSRTLRIETTLATAVAASMVVMTASVAIWWGVVASRAPWFLAGLSRGQPGSPFDLPMTGAMVIMAVSAVVGAYGAGRILRAPPAPVPTPSA